MVIVEKKKKFHSGLYSGFLKKKWIQKKNSINSKNGSTNDASSNIFSPFYPKKFVQHFIQPLPFEHPIGNEYKYKKKVAAMLAELYYLPHTYNDHYVKKK